MVTKLVEINSLIPHKIIPLVKVIIACGLLRVFLEQIGKFNRWDFIDVHDLINTEVDGREIVGFVKKKELFGLTIKMKNEDPVIISKVKSNSSITKLDHQMKNEKRLNCRSLTIVLKNEVVHFQSAITMKENNAWACFARKEPILRKLNKVTFFRK
ncbi:hypothetical protein MKX01_018870 [Papaver californicum]|nr:hypothetical protein MKX01_018870 [Papaver californicum]